VALEGEGPAIRFGESFSQESAVAFLRAAAGLDAERPNFRKDLKTDPIAAFANFGIFIDAELLPDNKILLPPKHHMEELLYYLAQEDEFGPVGVDPPLGFTIYIIVWAFKWSGT
jgi:hypothetical protein